MSKAKNLVENYLKEELSLYIGKGDDFRGSVISTSGRDGSFKFDLTIRSDISRYVAEPDKPIRTFERGEVFTGTVTHVGRDETFKFVIDTFDFRGVEFKATELWDR